MAGTGAGRPRSHVIKPRFPIIPLVVQDEEPSSPNSRYFGTAKSYRCAFCIMFLVFIVSEKVAVIWSNDYSSGTNYF